MKRVAIEIRASGDSCARSSHITRFDDEPGDPEYAFEAELMAALDEVETFAGTPGEAR